MAIKKTAQNAQIKISQGGEEDCYILSQLIYNYLENYCVFCGICKAIILTEKVFYCSKASTLHHIFWLKDIAMVKKQLTNGKSDNLNL